jgi:hypothetical protein
LGLDQLRAVRDQLTPLMALTDASVIERAAACAMLHSFYTEIEKMLKLIAIECDGGLPTSDAWHRELLNGMGAAAEARPAVLTPGMVEVLGEFLAFRHLFRGASIVLMRWDKLLPLVAKVNPTYDQTAAEVGAFVQFIEAKE